MEERPGEGVDRRRRPARFGATKFAPPAPPAVRVARPALLRRLDDAGAEALRLVVGSPGSGKSSLLAEWVDGLPAGSVAWLNADVADQDPVRFWQGAITAVQRCAAGFGAESFDLLTLDARVDQDMLESLLIDADALDEPVTVVVDDFHLVAPEVADHLAFLASRDCRGLRLTIGTRVEPPLRLGRLRMEGRLCEIREADLRFDANEAVAFTRAMDLDLTPDEVDVLQRRTEGWVAGLKLAVVAMHGTGEPAAFLQRLAGSTQVVTEYLSTEVVDAQEPAVRRFLLDTCVADELTPGLAATLAPGSAVTLADLEAANLLVTRLDPEGHTFRYHHLFAELLRYRLHDQDPDHEAELHRRAAAWFEAHGDVVSAFRHAWLAGRRAEAMEIVDGSVLDAYFVGRVHAVHQVIGALADADLRAAPGAAVGLALGLILEGLAEEALLLTDRIRSLHLGRLHRWDRVRLAATRCVALVALGDPTACLDEAQVLLDLATDHDALDDWFTVALTMLVRAGSWTGRLSEAEALAVRLPTGGPRPLERLEHAGSIAQLRLAQGRLAEAVDLARASLAFAAENPEHEVTIEILPRAVLGTALLEQGEVAAAALEFDWIAGANGETRRPMAALGTMGLSRVWQSEGRVEPALLVLDDARALFRNSPARAGVLDQIDARAARVLLAAGDRERAAALVERLPEGPDRRSLLAQLLLADGGHVEARRLLDAVDETDLPPATRLAGALARVSCALAAGESGEAEAAAVLAVAEPHGYLFAVAEAGADVLAAVCEVGRRRPQTPYLERLLHTRPHAVPADRPTIEYQIDALSDRERTVLRYLVTAMSYREIADDLYVSVNTVKTHVKHIIRKLHADSRADAIRRARELRYL
jgi:LuxR family maltose regulon positive regulatory protein